MIKKEKLKVAKYIYRTEIMSDFPRAERMPYARFKRFVKNNILKTYSYYIDGKRYGYIVTMEEDGVIFISYLAIKKEYRNMGYGTKMLKEIYKYFKNKKYIIIEVDSPERITNEKELDIIKRRKNFYFTNGFEEISGIDYCIYGVKYDLLVYKINSKEVSNKDGIEITKKLYSKIASNMNFFDLKVI